MLKEFHDPLWKENSEPEVILNTNISTHTAETKMDRTRERQASVLRGLVC